jgi:hypothetical protein
MDKRTTSNLLFAPLREIKRQHAFACWSATALKHVEHFFSLSTNEFPFQNKPYGVDGWPMTAASPSASFAEVMRKRCLWRSKDRRSFSLQLPCWCFHHSRQLKGFYVPRFFKKRILAFRTYGTLWPEFHFSTKLASVNRRITSVCLSISEFSPYQSRRDKISLELVPALGKVPSGTK